MKKTLHKYILFAIALFATVACSNEENIVIDQNNPIEISFGVAKYKNNIATTRTTNTGSDEEQEIQNLYLFLFSEDGSSLIKKYYINDPTTFTGGVWSEESIKLNLTQSEVGTSRVYLIANCDANLKTSLDGVSSVGALNNVYKSSNTPWSPTIGTPILMTGSREHNFLTAPKLNNIELIRAIAKLEINITLTSAHQAVPILNGDSQYRYKLIDFDERTYLFKPSPKGDNLASSDNWMNWGDDDVATYEIKDGKVVSLKVETYLNERDHAGTTIEIELPYNGDGPLPPPEFGPELYKVHLPATIERNHWYRYDIEK